MINSEIIIYQNPDGNIRLDVRLEDETVWLTQEHMARLFGKSKKTISEHIRNIFAESELDEHVVVRNFRTTTPHGAMAGKTQSRDVQFYNLDVIISVGYRVKSLQGTQFRIWATQRLREYIVKGFVLNDERFKTGNSMNYFTELQERIREIRVSYGTLLNSLNCSADAKSTEAIRRTPVHKCIKYTGQIYFTISIAM